MQTQPSPTTLQRSRGLTWAILLILLGGLLLLNNLGFLPWSIWETIVRLWPIALIALGAELLLGRSQPLVAGLAVALVILLVVGSAIAYVFAPVSQGSYIPLPVATHAETVAMPLAGASRGEVTLQAGVARLDLRAASPDAADLVHADATLPASGRIEQSSSTGGGTAVASLVERNDGSVGFPFDSGPTTGNYSWRVLVSPRIPVALNVTLGVGQSTLDLSALNVDQLQVTTGVGDTTVTLPGQARHTQATVRGGVGHLTLVVPPNVRARIATSGGIGAVNAGGRFQKVGNVYQTVDAPAGANQLDLDLHLGVGSVDLQ